MRRALTGILLVAAACEDRTAPPPRTPASIAVVSSPPGSVAVGVSAGPLVVRVTDGAGRTLRGVVVYFRVTQGAGHVAPSIDTSDANGTASAVFTASSVPGTNEVTASVAGLAPLRVTVTGTLGVTRSVNISPREIRLVATQDSSAVAVTPRDTYGNATSDAVDWTVRDSSLVSVTTTASRASTGATVRVLRRPGQTWIVGSSGSGRDSIRVTVQDSASSPCDFIAAPATLSVGGTLTMPDGVACVASDTDAEYAVVLHYNTVVAGVTSSIEVTGSGITSPQTPFPLVAGAPAAPAPDIAFETALRARESREIGPRVAGARAWYQRSPAVGLYAIGPGVKEGDLVSLNTNAFDFCTNPKPRTARVVAITQSAVVLADTSNPTGGFTDDEYRSFGVAMDTLVQPVDTAAFGQPSDIDGNHRVGILFTRAVNALTGPGGSAIILGFYYLRDLLPVRDASGNCPGSNQAEMFYVLVPDPDGTVNANPRSKDFVRSLVIATVAHEYQHLINASRRMYVTLAPLVDEEPWLNEGLSHIAEELVFYHASGASPRTNIGASRLAPGTPLRAAFDVYQRSNLARYREFLRAPTSASPVAQDDGLAVRGAAWSFLRYLADRTRTSDGDFWRRLVNSSATGVSNLQQALGGPQFDLLGVLRDWSMSVLLDDTPAASSAAFRQPSWDFVTSLPVVLSSFGLVPRVLSDRVPATTAVLGGGAGYLRFGVAAGKQALLSARTPSGNAVPQAMRLTIVRIK